MRGTTVCRLAAVLVVVCVTCPGHVTSQCTTSYCGEGEEETDLWTTVQRLQESFDSLQQRVTQQNEMIRSLQEEIAGPKCKSTKATIGVDINLPNFCTKSHQLALKGDFNGDGQVDILCHDSQNGSKWISYGSNGAYSDIGWERDMHWCWHDGSSLYVGDFNGDNKTDILCHDGRRVWIAYANSVGAFVSTDWEKGMNFCACAGCTLCIGDFNNDGKSDMLCHEYPTTPRWLIAYATVNSNFENA